MLMLVLLSRHVGRMGKLEIFPVETQEHSHSRWWQLSAMILVVTKVVSRYIVNLINYIS